MAWHALYKWFIRFRKIPYTNWVNWYRHHLYVEWFKTLSEEEQKVELERQRMIKEKRKQDREKALARLGMMFNVMNEFTHGRMYDYMETARSVNEINIHPSKYW